MSQHSNRHPRWGIILITLFIVGCQENNPKKTVAPVTSATAPPVVISPTGEKTAELRAEIIPMPEPNLFHVSLTWGATDGGAREWILQRESKRTGLKHLVTLEPSHHQYLDTKVAAGEHYIYYLRAGAATEPETRYQVAITIPSDLRIQKIERFESIRDIHRLFLESGSILIPTDNRLAIDVAEIISHGGQIRTFAPEGVLGRQSGGRTGALISIRAKRAVGELTIVSEGQDGTRGLDGTAGAVGAAGAPGAPGELEFGGPDLKGFIPRDQLLREAQRASDRDPSGKTARIYYRCKHPPSPGLVGSPGGNGSRGHDGARGGDSGRLIVDIESASDLQLHRESRASRGGGGGSGGSAGRGGAGGAPGAPDKYGICPAAAAGAEGPAGLPGPAGNAGPDGKIDPYCLRLGESRLGDCVAFESFLRGVPSQTW
jgi:hypothetical protein